jgi:hypothetical protein
MIGESGNIIRNIFGTSYKEAESITINASEGPLSFKSPKEITFHGKNGGKKFGDYVVKEEEEQEITFSGWWSPDYDGTRNLERDSINPKAYLEETVYFQLNVSNHIPLGTNITFQLWDKDTPFKSSPNFDDNKFDGEKVFRDAVVREVNGKHRITIELFLSPKWHNDIIKDKKLSYNLHLEFYWTWKYNNQKWNSVNNLLHVYPSKTTLFIKPAYEGYGFPEIRTADGDIIVFSAGIVATEEPSKELEEAMETILDDIKANAMRELREKMVKYSDKLRYTLAVKQLKKGHLANNMGKIEFSRRIYTQPVFDNSGKVYEITKAANFGYKKDGKLVTTKGISQLDYFREVGIRNTILKGAEKLSWVLQILDVLKFDVDEKADTIITAFVPLDFLNAMVYPSIREPIVRIWNDLVVDAVEKAKDNGIRGIRNLAGSNWFNKNKYGKYNYIEISSEMLNKLLTNKYKTFEDLEREQIELRKSMNQYEYQSGLVYTVFYCEKIDNEIEKLITYVETIFIN